MSNVGTTTGDEPDYVEDADLLSLDELRGTMKDIHAAKLSNAERSTIRGYLDEMKIVKDMLAELTEQNNRLVGLYGTMRAEFEVFKANHAASLSLKINGGSTTPEDYGPNT